MTPMEELREQAAKIAPCPFCGENLRHASHKGVEFWMHPGVVTDDDCVLSGKGFYPKELTAWNRRALPAPVALPQAGEDRARKLLTDLDALLGKPIRTGPVAEQAFALILAPTETPTAAPPDDGQQDFSRITLRHNVETILREYRDAHPATLLDKIMSVVPRYASPAPDDGLMGRYRSELTASGLRKLRQAANIKAKDLASLLDISPEHVSRMENGEKPISRVMALAVIAALSTATGDEAQQGEG